MQYFFNLLNYKYYKEIKKMNKYWLNEALYMDIVSITEHYINGFIDLNSIII